MHLCVGNFHILFSHFCCCCASFANIFFYKYFLVNFCCIVNCTFCNLLCCFLHPSSLLLHFAQLFAHWPSSSVVVVVALHVAAALELKAVLLNSSGKLVSFTGTHHVWHAPRPALVPRSRSLQRFELCICEFFILFSWCLCCFFHFFRLLQFISTHTAQSGTRTPTLMISVRGWMFACSSSYPHATLLVAVHIPWENSWRGM